MARLHVDIQNIFEKFDYHPIEIGDNKYVIYEEANGPSGEPGLEICVVEVRIPTDEEQKLFLENVRKLNEGGY